MLAKFEGGFVPATGDKSGRAASSVVSERSESSDPFDSAKLAKFLTSLSDLQIQDPASEVKIFMEFAPLEGDSEAIPPAAEPILTVPRSELLLGKAHQAEGDISEGLMKIVSPSFEAVQKPRAQRIEWKMFLWREDSEVALGHSDFL